MLLTCNFFLQLDISEISEIQPCLAKLKAVVKAVPRMERFISQVCGYVFPRHPSLGEVDGMKSVGGSAVPNVDANGQSAYTMEHMLPILKRYVLLVQYSYCEYIAHDLNHYCSSLDGGTPRSAAWN